MNTKDARQSHILVVDDVPDNLSLLHDALDEAGYTVLVATSGEQALARAAQAQPDIVLLDALMPGMDGFEVCERIRAVPQVREIPIILVDTAFWQGLLDWLRERLVGEGMISAEDLDLIQVIDKPEDVVEAIFKHYERRGFQPLPTEREMMLNL